MFFEIFFYAVHTDVWRAQKLRWLALAQGIFWDKLKTDFCRTPYITHKKWQTTNTELLPILYCVQVYFSAILCMQSFLCMQQ
jgi:hypothetical protein